MHYLIGRDTTTTLSPSTSMDATSPTHHLSTTLNSSSNSVNYSLHSTKSDILFNAKSVANKLRQLHAGENIDIIAVTETHRYKTNGPQSFCLQERQKLVRGRDYNMLLVRNNIPATRLHDLKTDCQSELLYGWK